MPAPDAVDRWAEAEILVHGERGEADIHPVEEIDHVAEAEKRQQPARGLADGRLPRLMVHRPSPPPGPLTTNRRDSGHERRAWRPSLGYSRPLRQPDSISGRTLMAIPLDAAAAAMREAMRETVKRYSTLVPAPRRVDGGGGRARPDLPAARLGRHGLSARLDSDHQRRAPGHRPDRRRATCRITGCSSSR